MDKKAIEMTMQTIVVAAIALIVLFTVVIIFRAQISKTTQQFFGIGQQATSELNATSCAGGFFSTKKCAVDCLTDIKDGYYWHSVGALDCKGGQVCCERGDPKPS